MTEGGGGEQEQEQEQGEEEEEEEEEEEGRRRRGRRGGEQQEEKKEKKEKEFGHKLEPEHLLLFLLRVFIRGEEEQTEWQLVSRQLIRGLATHRLRDKREWTS